MIARFFQSCCHAEECHSLAGVHLAVLRPELQCKAKATQSKEEAVCNSLSCHPIIGSSPLLPTKRYTPPTSPRVFLATAVQTYPASRLVRGCYLSQRTVECVLRVGEHHRHLAPRLAGCAGGWRAANCQHWLIKNGVAGSPHPGSLLLLLPRRSIAKHILPAGLFVAQRDTD